MGSTRRRTLRRTLAALAGLLAPLLASSLITGEGGAAAAGRRPQSWTVSTADGVRHGLSVVDGLLRLTAAAQRPASLRAGTPEGVLDLPPHQLAEPVDRVSVTTDADTPPGSAVEVQARGLRADGRWTEWSLLAPGRPATLEAPTRTVALRLLLRAAPDGSSPVLRVVRAAADRSADTVAQTLRAATDTLRALTFRVYATREGLVGGTTANGHVIVPDDHFVALPSRRALSANGKGDYTVKICAESGRCEWAPVWDVGPWNTTDDHWSPPAQRQRWQDLAQGLPEAQAAYLAGYNGGRDQFGRRVGNPAGIDLADGTFTDGLGLRTNSYVSVSYLWLAGGPAGQARTYGTPLAVRAGPGRGFANVGYIAEQARVGVECRLPGDVATGTQGTSNVWYRIGPGQYASAAWISGAPPLPGC